MRRLIREAASLLKAADPDGSAESDSGTGNSNENHAMFHCWDTFADDSKVKVTFALEQAMKVQMGSRGIVGVGPSRFTPGQETRHHCTGDWVSPRTGLDGCGKISPPSGFDPRNVQPLASRYTDYGDDINDPKSPTNRNNEKVKNETCHFTYYFVWT
jgi:hypothetical protein